MVIFGIRSHKMRKIKTNLEELMLAFEECRLEHQYWLDLHTGELFFVSRISMLSDEIDEIYERIESEPDRYLKIPEQSSHEGYQDMVDFAETVEDENLKEKLYIALDGKGAFRRFKNVLYYYPEEREKWFKFKDERLKARVLEWLKENALELESQ